MKKEMTEQEAFLQLASMCAKAEHCQHEMLEKMRKWEVPETVQARVMARLVKERYVDDERYARAFVHDKLAFNRWGRLRLRRELRAKHIAAEAIDAALAAIDEVAYRDTLLALLRAKLPQGGDTSPQARARLLRNAMSHGFETSLVIDCLRQLALGTHDLEPLIDDGAEGLD